MCIILPIFRFWTQVIFTITNKLPSHDSAVEVKVLDSSQILHQTVVLSRDLLFDVKRKVETFLTTRWVPILHHNALHVVFLSAHNNLAILQSLVFSFSGTVDLYVHCNVVNVDDHLKNVMPPVPLSFERYQR
jgi:hypothetical protein